MLSAACGLDDALELSKRDNALVQDNLYVVSEMPNGDDTLPRVLPKRFKHLVPKLKAYQLQQKEGLDTVEANRRLGFGPDLRQYGIGAQILVDLGIRKIRLLTNNPKKVVGLEGFGLRIEEEIRIQIPPTESNRKYLKTKKDKLGPLLDDME